MALLLLLPAAASAQDCAPAVDLTGDEALVAQIAPILTRDGMSVKPIAGCPAETVRVTAGLDGTELVHIVDAQGRASERTVDRPAVAAAVIESWARSDLTSGLLAPRLPPAVSPIAWSASVGPRFDAGSDGSVWVGAELAFHLGVGPVELGARADVRHDTAAVGGYDVEHAGRTGGAFLAEVVWPIGRGRISFAPSVGFGAMWDHVERRVEDDTGIINAGSPALAAGATLRLARRIALALAASAEWAPLADPLLHDEDTGAYFPEEPKVVFGAGVDLVIGGAP